MKRYRIEWRTKGQPQPANSGFETVSCDPEGAESTEVGVRALYSASANTQLPLEFYDMNMARAAAAYLDQHDDHFTHHVIELLLIRTREVTP